MSSNGKIFIQIAAYRDPQLVPTIKECIANAKHPENLVFCIAWQHSQEEKIDEIKDLPNVKIIDIPYMQSRGACWARNRIQQQYDGEEYTLQLDSHHRFVKDWDEVIIGMYKQLQDMGHKKPLLTGYIPSFDPDNDPAGRTQVPWKMDFDRFIPEGAVFFLPASIDNWKELSAPVPSRFYSAHFAFTTGKFCKEVPHDPEYYFHGEEISIAVRAFTWGYDLFHPHRLVAWHEYTRKGRTKHWDDHNGNNKAKIPDKLDWGERNSLSHRRNRILFSMDGEKHETIKWGKYGFGKVRTLRDYEKYAGLHFGKRAVQQETIDKAYPPNKYHKYKTEKEWEDSFLQIFKHCIDLQTNSFKLNDYDFWCVVFEREDNTQLHRQDADAAEVDRLIKGGKDPSGDKYIKLWRTFNTSEKPHHWVVWPHSKSKGWCDKITGNL
jgi:glycosyltransferase involved in cell wall biosynthesis